MLARSVLWAIVVASGLICGTAHAATFEPIDFLPGAQGLGSVPTDVSADGRTIVGFVYRDEGSDESFDNTFSFRWQDGVTEALAGCGGDESPSVSDDGLTIVAGCHNEDSDSVVLVNGIVERPPTPDNWGTTFTAVSGDGQVFFGDRGYQHCPQVGYCFGLSEAVRVAPGGNTVIGFLPGDLRSLVDSASYDGAVAAIESRLQSEPDVGDPDSGEDRINAAAWQNDALIALGSLGGGTEDFNDDAALDVSADGSTIVGISGIRAFKHTTATGMVDLGFPPGATMALATAVSGDGSVIVGSYAGPGVDGRPAIWTAADGAQDLQKVLVGQYGIDLGGWELLSATGISASGGTIVGLGIDPATGRTSGWRAVLRGADFSFEAVTRERGHVTLDETVRYTATATSTGQVLQLRIAIDLPRDTTVVAESVTPGGRVEGTQLVWDFLNSGSETVTFDLKVGPQQPGTLFVPSTAHFSVGFAGGGEVTADREIVLRYAESAFDIADAHPDELSGLLLPNARNARTLATLDFSKLRFVNGVAADGVSLLLVRARIPRKEHGRIVMSVSQNQYAGAATGDLWQTDDASIIDTSADGGARDGMPNGPLQIELDSEPNRAPGARKGEQVAFALYRAPRDFDAGDATATLNERGVIIRVDVYDKKNKEIVEGGEFELRVVRPLLVLQHGTFDSPAGWDTSPLWARTGNQNKAYFGWDPDFPFQTGRSQFNTVQGAAGFLIDSAPVAYRSLVKALANWRRVTGYAGSQADVVCHSYGGVNMRWASQLQADPSPIAVDAEGSFRNAGNWGHGAFHKLITIASTHRGSAVSNQLAYLNEFGLKPGAIRFTAQYQKAWIDRGGVEDQMVVSPILRQLRRTRVPGHAIAGAGLAHFNAGYSQRLASLWGSDVQTGPFRQFGPPFDYVDEKFVYSPTVLRALATYGFNLDDGFTIHDDETQDPNFDLTVSSYSSKASMTGAAQSDYRDVASSAGVDPNELLGPLTHGDQISAGSGNRFPMWAAAMRVAFLLRQPTTSPYFSNFPAVQDTPLTPLELEFSNVTSFPPAGLYRTISSDSSDARARQAAGPASAPVLSVVPDVAIVHPGDTLAVTVSWPGATIDGGWLAFPGADAEAGETRLLLPDVTTHTITVVVPKRSPGEFALGAVVMSAGEVATASRSFELADASAYTALQFDPERLVIRSDASASFQVLGKLPSGEWRALNESPRLQLSSSDATVAAVDANGTLLPGSFGGAVITATFDGEVSVQMPVEVSGAVVSSTAAVRKRGKVRRKAKKPSDFVFLSGPGFDPASIDVASVRVAGLAAVKTKVKDVNKDSVKDLVAFVSLRSLPLAAGPTRIVLTARTKAGGRIAGAAAVTLR